MNVAEAKQSFFENNNYSEISAETSTKGFQDIDEDKYEIWLLQCPKGLDVQTLENQKLKFPGRTKIGEYEATAIEETTTHPKMAFGYARKQKYQVKLLPVAGKIVLRKQISGHKNVREPNVQDVSQLTSVPMPEYIKLRHPLLGAKFDEYIKSTNSSGSPKITIKVEKRSPVKTAHPSEATKAASKKFKHKKLNSGNLDISDDLKWIKEL